MSHGQQIKVRELALPGSDGYSRPGEPTEQLVKFDRGPIYYIRCYLHPSSPRYSTSA
jgi:hypothetical protein